MLYLFIEYRVKFYTLSCVNITLDPFYISMMNILFEHVLFLKFIGFHERKIWPTMGLNLYLKLNG